MFERRVVPVIVRRSCRETIVVYSGSCSVHKIHDVEITHLVVLSSSGRESELTLIIALSGTLFFIYLIKLFSYPIWMVLDSSFFIVHLAAYKRPNLIILINLKASHVNSYELIIIMKVKDQSGLARLRYGSHQPRSQSHSPKCLPGGLLYQDSWRCKTSVIKIAIK